jgi:hypothetical protein
MFPSKVSQNRYKTLFIPVQNRKYTFLTLATLASEEVTYIDEEETIE